MKGEYYFSPSQVAFYPASLREVYEHAGCWPVDGEWVSAELHEQLMNEQAAGRAISSDVNGNPVAIERPPLSVSNVAPMSGDGGIVSCWRPTA